MIRDTAIVVLLLTLQTIGICDATDRVIVELRGVVEPKSQMIAVADVAKVSGGDLLLRRKIGKLDLALLDDDRVRSISKRQVRLRIELAGVPWERVRILGAENVLLKKSEAKSPENGAAKRDFLELLRPEIAQSLDVEQKDLQLRLPRPLASTVTEHLASGNEHQLFLPTTTRIGTQTVRIGLYDNGRLTATVPVVVEVTVFRDVLVATRSIERGDKVTDSDVTRKRRPLTRQMLSTLEGNVVGKRARRQIKEGSTISKSDIDQSMAKEIVIQNRDTVEVVARRKSVTITVSGAMALQRGAVGDSIRVKTPGSGKVLTAKVVDAGTVELRL